MPSFCAVVGCSNRGNRNYTKSFYRFPSIKDNHGQICPKLLKKRDLWVGALRRKDFPESKIKYSRICSDHFVTGKPSNDVNHVDYVPSLKLGYEKHFEKMTVKGRRTKKLLMEQKHNSNFEEVYIKEEPSEEMLDEANEDLEIPVQKEIDSCSRIKKETVFIKQEYVGTEELSRDASCNISGNTFNASATNFDNVIVKEEIMEPESSDTVLYKTLVENTKKEKL